LILLTWSKWSKWSKHFRIIGRKKKSLKHTGYVAHRKVGKNSPPNKLVKSLAHLDHLDQANNHAGFFDSGLLGLLGPPWTKSPPWTPAAGAAEAWGFAYAPRARERFKSLAVELHRLSHSPPAPNELDDDFNVAVIVRDLTPTLPEQPRRVSKNSPLCHDDTNREVNARTVPSARLVEKAQHRIFARDLCLCCRAIGRTTKAEVSDHVLPIALGGRWQGELQPASARCHSTVKRELERRFKAGRCAASDLRLDSKMAMELARMQYRTIGIDGFPIA
jgi:hypothetical protein